MLIFIFSQEKCQIKLFEKLAGSLNHVAVLFFLTPHCVT